MVLKSIGLTGASGMVGRQLLHVAAQRAIGCRTSSRFRPKNLRESDTWTAWDLAEWRSAAELDVIFGDIDALIHAGAVVAPNSPHRWHEMLDANVRACLCLGEWANRKGIPMVFISGATVYADPTRASIVETDLKTSGDTLGGFYGLTKYLGELVLNHLCVNGLKLVILRPASIYGPGLPPKKLVYDFLQTASAGKVLTLKQPVGDCYNLVHACDVAAAAFDALTNDAFGVFNIAGCNVTLAGLAEACVSVAGRGAISVSELPGRAPRSVFDLNSAAATAAFGYRPKTSIREGLETMLDEGLQRE